MIFETEVNIDHEVIYALVTKGSMGKQYLIHEVMNPMNQVFSGYI